MLCFVLKPRTCRLPKKFDALFETEALYVCMFDCTGPKMMPRVCFVSETPCQSRTLSGRPIEQKHPQMGWTCVQTAFAFYSATLKSTSASGKHRGSPSTEYVSFVRSTRPKGIIGLQTKSTLHRSADCCLSKRSCKMLQSRVSNVPVSNQGHGWTSLKKQQNALFIVNSFSWTCLMDSIGFLWKPATSPHTSRSCFQPATVHSTATGLPTSSSLRNRVASLQGSYSWTSSSCPSHCNWAEALKAYIFLGMRHRTLSVTAMGWLNLKLQRAVAGWTQTELSMCWIPSQLGPHGSNRSAGPQP